MSIFTKKPVTVEAVQWTGLNVAEVMEFLGHAPVGKEHFFDLESGNCVIRTNQAEGDWRAKKDDIIVKDLSGRFSVTNPFVFGKLFEPEGRAPSTLAQEIAARVWCDQSMKHVVMNYDACRAIAIIVDEALNGALV